MNKNLVHIGYGKAGSTFLKRWFLEHRQLQYVEKETAGFNNIHDIPKWAIVNNGISPKYYVTSQEILGAGWANLNRPLVSIQNIRSIITGREMARNQTKVCQTLYELFHDSKVLITTRGFKSILISGYSEHIKFGGELSMEGYLSELKPFFLQWLDVNFLVTLYSETFGAENVIILPYELLQADQSAFLHSLEEKLNIDHQDIDPGRPNPSLSTGELFWYTRVSKYILAPIANTLGLRAAAFIYRKYSEKVIRPNRLRRGIQALTFFTNQSPKLAVPAEYLNIFSGKATILRDHPLYGDYLAEYLIQ